MAMQFKFFTMLTFIENTLLVVPPPSLSSSPSPPPGYYADEEAECQVFHICGSEAAKFSFLCPNGTIFNQNYFICDWWFNVDCAESAAIAEAKNNELAETREAATAAAADRAAEGSDAVGEYAAPEAEVGFLPPAAADSLAGYGQELGGYNRRRL